MTLHEQKMCKEFINWGVLASIEKDNDDYVSADQFTMLRGLLERPTASFESLQLFASNHELLLSASTGLFLTNEKRRDVPGSEIIAQLLPRILEHSRSDNGAASLGKIQLPGSGVNLLSRDTSVLEAVEQIVNRFYGSSLQRDKTSALARSANYMGAKTILCPAITEVIDAYLPKDGVILDLMCGSGATAGAFSQRWKVYASDAQAFSRHLAMVQGGGMTVTHARGIVEHVIELAKPNFSRLAELIGDDILKEEKFLMSELSAADADEFITWAVSYPRVNTSAFSSNPLLVSELDAHRKQLNSAPSSLFIRYYANLFFGVRQAAEIDSLRSAIEQLNDPHEKNWAIGALICAVSACADNYGGHFAQPRFDSSSPERLAAKFRETIAKRTMSITQEFSARLISLASESERAAHCVEQIEGPWQHGISEAKRLFGKQPTLVYVDPPYTRDEYSRYYHVLETLVRYDYPIVAGKASIPLKGSSGRFASEFFTRSISSVEETLSEVIASCLENNWACLWSYSSSGIADIQSVVNRLGPLAKTVDIYKAKYAYKQQGKRKVGSSGRELNETAADDLRHHAPSKIKKGTTAPRSVDEYMIMIRPTSAWN